MARLVSKADLAKQHTIGVLLRPVQEYRLKHDTVMRQLTGNWDRNKPPIQIHSPRFN